MFPSGAFGPEKGDDRDVSEELGVSEQKRFALLTRKQETRPKKHARFRHLKLPFCLHFELICASPRIRPQTYAAKKVEESNRLTKQGVSNKYVFLHGMHDSHAGFVQSFHLMQVLLLKSLFVASTYLISCFFGVSSATYFGDSTTISRRNTKKLT